MFFFSIVLSLFLRAETEAAGSALDKHLGDSRGLEGVLSEV